MRINTLVQPRVAFRVLVVSCLALGGLVNAQTPAGSTPSVSVVAAGASDYILLPSDTLQVRIFQEEDLTREVSISQEYTISLPLVGTINVRDKSVRQTEELIRQLYDKDYLVNPQVTLSVLRYAERTVNVIGSVNSPQPVPFPVEKGLTLLEAITRAGGFSRLANMKRVTITRQGVAKPIEVNAERLIDGRSFNLQLQVGDLINVPEGTW